MNIIELAKEAGLNMPDRRNDLWMPQLERFAAIVRAEALEEAAKVCEERLQIPMLDAAHTMEIQLCAAAIRGMK